MLSSDNSLQLLLLETGIRFWTDLLASAWAVARGAGVLAKQHLNLFSELHTYALDRPQDFLDISPTRA
ncbi:hypothetical protein GCM10009863_63990 [Streptomyces axinellae]|uniref:Uncharacterized protein n=1 Tax=Streptomyces axinellae TaxID=552788 RepID=A0ABN3QYI6_9ACTN